MLYIILLTVFGAVGVFFYFLYKPTEDAMKRNVFRQKEHVAHELEQMFIFISVDGLQKIKWILAVVMAGVGLILSWEAKPPGSHHNRSNGGGGSLLGAGNLHHLFTPPAACGVQRTAR